mgnify:CR=1 FL=1
MSLSGTHHKKEPLSLNCAPIVRHNLTNWRRSFYEEIFRRRETNGCEKYLSNEGSFKRIGDSIGADEGDVRSWVQRFQYHGNEAFKNSYARYSVKDN